MQCDNNHKHMKYKLLLIIVCLLSFFSMNAQTKSSKETSEYTPEEIKKDTRASGDSILLGGNTLYLIFDKTDSLQVKKKKSIEWWQRPMTEKEKEDQKNPRYADAFDLGKIATYLAQSWKLISKKELSPEEVEKLTLTTRKKLVDFHKRELKRNESRKSEDKHFKRYVWDWGSWDLKWYFDKVYMIEPKADGTFIMYELKV